MNRLTVSIAMCTYNGERFLQEQLNSFSAQTRLPDEIVVCDDGSTDKTLEILENWAKTAPFSVRIIRNEKNLGYAQNFGKAVSLCTCDVIFLSDQDDIWEPEKIEKMTEIFENEPEIGLVVSDGFIINENNQRQSGSAQELLRLWYYDEACAFCEYNPRPNDCFPQGCASAFRATLKSVYLPIPSLWSHDIWLQVIAHFCTRGKILYKPLFSYRLYDNNTSQFGNFEARKYLWEKKKKIYIWNMPQQYWAWQSQIVQFRERIESTPASEQKKRLLQQLKKNSIHFTNRNRIQRNLILFGPLLFLELISGRYREHLFSLKSISYDIRVGLKNSINPIKFYREMLQLLKRL